MEIVYFLLIGGAAGWLAGQLIKGRGFGLLGNVVVGVLGAIVGGFVFPLVGIGAKGLLGKIVLATLGAVLLLAALAFFAVRRRR
jgi:uncharacterized membrane protein YeaQ/YmgE (transglycosylase-associated protein family)